MKDKSVVVLLVKEKEIKNQKDIETEWKLIFGIISTERVLVDRNKYKNIAFSAKYLYFSQIKWQNQRLAVIWLIYRHNLRLFHGKRRNNNCRIRTAAAAANRKFSYLVDVLWNSIPFCIEYIIYAREPDPNRNTRSHSDELTYFRFAWIFLCFVFHFFRSDFCFYFSHLSVDFFV